MTHSRTFRVLFLGSLVYFPALQANASAKDDDPVRTIQAGDGPRFRFELSKDGKTMVTGSFLRGARVWDITTWREIGKLEYPGIFRALSPDGKTLAIVSVDDAHLWLFEIGTDNFKRTDITGPFGHSKTNAVLCAAYSSDGKLLATSGNDTVVKLWDAATMKKSGELSRIDSPPSYVRFSPDSTLVAAASWKGEVRVWKVKTREQVCAFRVGDTGRSVAFSPDGTLLAAGGSNGFVTLIDMGTGHQQSTLSPKDATNAVLDAIYVRLLEDSANNVSAISFSPDRKLLAMGQVNGLVILWDLASLQELRRFEKHRSSISNIAFLPDGKTMITSDSDNGLIAVWDVSMFVRQQTK